MTPCSDLRSDTITQPTAAMRDAMMNAPLGDDVLGDDPTVLELQRRMAELLGKEQACFVPSGTMANQLAIRTQTHPGDEILCHDDSHIYRYEAGGPAALSGCSFAFLPGQRGMFEADTINEHVRIDDAHFPNSSLLVVENTQNRGGGAPWPMNQLAAVTQRAHELGLKRHLDGARLWNASVATGETPKSIAAHFDTVSTCFSKGLGAPVGSIVAGDAATMARAHRFRKMLGGAMRQSGLLAAAALYAIDHHIDRLAEDHERARRLAEAIASCKGLSVDASSVETNIVYFDVDNAPEFVKALDMHGVRMLDLGPSRVRAVTSLAIDDDGIDHAIKVLQDLTS
ncbi:MAG: GntG family PLP-dependent aldolase [Phycisphaerales bacterium]|nr:GntG family PLP-dependent aldolase [Phycisphaerales bacterium]